ncbi:MAG TPA: outer membrane beta-barrel protein [Candidatus Eisenbacteria bacterium]|nr:outer membrane beta-barrel protein [Candidatus Eisenbacteria bacterium]
MRRVHSTATLILGSALLLATATPALADISVGTNFGVAIYSPEEGGDNSTLIGVPSQAGLIGTIRPGLRVGGAGEKRDHEGYVDLSYDAISSNGSGIHALRIGANYQYNFGGSSTRPYLTFGGGIYNVGGESVSATSPTFGGGVGLGVPLSENHGRFRIEFRLDHLNEGKDGGDVVIDAANVYQFTAGFDLWMKN